MKVEKNYTMSDPKGVPFVSVAIGTHNKARSLDLAISSIKKKNRRCPFSYEIIVVDDKSTDDTFEVCKLHSVIYGRIPENTFRNPSRPRNLAFRMAKGQVIVHQSDEVIHETEDSLEKLVSLVTESNYCIATVWNFSEEKNEILELYTGLDRMKPYFFLGAIKKSHLELVSGYDENYITAGYDDDSLADKLARVGVYPVFTEDIVGHHLDHSKGLMSCGYDSSARYFKNLYEKA